MDVTAQRHLCFLVFHFRTDYIKVVDEVNDEVWRLKHHGGVVKAECHGVIRENMKTRFGHIGSLVDQIFQISKSPSHPFVTLTYG